MAKRRTAEEAEADRRRREKEKATTEAARLADLFSITVSLRTAGSTRVLYRSSGPKQPLQKHAEEIARGWSLIHRKATVFVRLEQYNRRTGAESSVEYEIHAGKIWTDWSA